MNGNNIKKMTHSFLTKIICVIALIATNLHVVFAKNPEQVKNIIMMIPDGTSASVLTLSRLYKSGIGYAEHQQIDKTHLHIDPFICGLVKTYSSDAPIGDSAPTGSTYATGVVSQAGYVATYPEKTKNDIVFVNPDLANTPAMTILEAAKLAGKSTGLAVTVEFPHATPADFSAHTSNRGDYKSIASQMVKNNIDVVFGGGINYLNDENRNYLQQNGWEVIPGDYNRFNSFSGEKVWGLFAPTDLPYDLDRNASECPSLKEMTEKAIRILSKNENGFFLMVEGSKVDWAAHANDPIAMITDFLAFDEAVKVATDFAIQNGNTAVIVCPDHGNSGLSIGGPNTNSGYSKKPKNDFIAPLINSKKTLEGFAQFISGKENTKTGLKQDFADYLGINELNADELASLMKSTKKNLKTNRIEQGKVKSAATKIFNSKTCLGFTTSGHTGEDVFLGVYHPKGDILTGVRHNVEVNEYMQQLFGVNLTDSTKTYFCGHKTLFPSDRYKCEVNKVNDAPMLRVTSNKTKKNVLLKAYDNAVLVDGKTTVSFRTVFVYMDKRDEFFIPLEVKELID